jgi:predicted DNA-binding antitoxin AbrB/MazE fold protein
VIASEKEKIMETIEAIYENGILRPLRPLQLQEHQAVRLVILTEDMEALAASQKKALLDLAGIGRSGRSDVSTAHDTYLYRKA